jgi:hypothetical protein
LLRSGSFEAVEASEALLQGVDRSGVSSLHVYARRDSSTAFKRILLSLNRHDADAQETKDASRSAAPFSTAQQGESAERGEGG